MYPGKNTKTNPYLLGRKRVSPIISLYKSNFWQGSQSSWAGEFLCSTFFHGNYSISPPFSPPPLQQEFSSSFWGGHGLVCLPQPNLSMRNVVLESMRDSGASTNPLWSPKGPQFHNSDYGHRKSTLYIYIEKVYYWKRYIYIYIQGYSRFLFQHYNAVIATEPNLTYYTLSVICSNSAWNSTPTVGIEKIAHKLPENRIEL